MLDRASLDDWGLGVLIEVCWTPRHWMIKVLTSYGGVLDTASLDDWSIGVITEVC